MSYEMNKKFGESVLREERREVYDKRFYRARSHHRDKEMSSGSGKIYA